MRTALVMGLLLAACGGSDSGGPPGGGTTGGALQGTWIGSYTASLAPGSVYQGVMQLTQNGASVSGTLTTNTGRSASVSGSVSGSRLTAGFTFTDTCHGSASTTADLSGTQLSGNYTASDCSGGYTGGYVLTKQ